MPTRVLRLYRVIALVMLVALANTLLVFLNPTGHNSLLYLFAAPLSSASNTACTLLPSKDPQLQVELCYATDACNVGTVTITAPPSHCSNASFLRADQSDAAPDVYLAPHVFQLHIHGAARTAVRAETAAFLGPEVCAWQFDFDVRTAGSLGFQIDHITHRNQTFNNVDDDAQPADPNSAPEEQLVLPHFAPLIDSSAAQYAIAMPLDRSDGNGDNNLIPHVINMAHDAFYPAVELCPSHLAPSLPARARPQTNASHSGSESESFSDVPLDDLSSDGQSDDLFDVTLPECSRQLPVEGVYRRADSADIWRGGKSPVAHQGYVWEPQSGCTMDRLPHVDVPPSEVDALLGQHERSILFVGDSHARYAYNLFTSWYRQDWQYLTEPYATKQAPSWSRGRAKFGFQWDAFLDRAPAAAKGNCSEFAATWGKYDTVVLSGGHHLAITNAPGYPSALTTTEEYVARVRENIAAFLQTCDAGKKAPRIVWLGTPAFQPSPASEAKPWTDARSNSRLALWTARAADMLRKDFPSVAVVDQYELTLPWTHHTPDGLHFYGTDAAYAIVSELNHKIGMGRARGWWNTQHVG